MMIDDNDDDNVFSLSLVIIINILNILCVCMCMFLLYRYISQKKEDGSYEVKIHGDMLEYLVKNKSLKRSADPDSEDSYPDDGEGSKWECRPRIVREVVRDGVVKFTCTCGFFETMAMPCHHWYAVLYQQPEFRQRYENRVLDFIDFWYKPSGIISSGDFMEGDFSEEGSALTNPPVKRDGQERKGKQPLSVQKRSDSSCKE
jgi:hypothetical protein